MLQPLYKITKSKTENIIKFKNIHYFLYKFHYIFNINDVVFYDNNRYFTTKNSSYVH